MRLVRSSFTALVGLRPACTYSGVWRSLAFQSTTYVRSYRLDLKRLHKIAVLSNPFHYLLYLLLSSVAWAQSKLVINDFVHYIMSLCFVMLHYICTIRTHSHTYNTNDPMELCKIVNRPIGINHQATTSCMGLRKKNRSETKFSGKKPKMSTIAWNTQKSGF